MLFFSSNINTFTFHYFSSFGVKQFYFLFTLYSIHLSNICVLFQLHFNYGKQFTILLLFIINDNNATVSYITDDSLITHDRSNRLFSSCEHLTNSLLAHTMFVLSRVVCVNGLLGMVLVLLC